MYLFYIEYENIFWFLILNIILAIILIILARLLGSQYLTTEKLSAYECGFEPFRTARIKFNVSFAIIAILFLIFDLEIIFLIPWVLNIIEIGFLGFLMVYIFLFLLIIGFIFELLRNILDWEKDFV